MSQKQLQVSVGRFAKDVSGTLSEATVRKNIDTWLKRGLDLGAPLPEKSGPGSVSPLWLLLTTSPSRDALVWEYVDKLKIDPTKPMDSLGRQTLLSAAASRPTLLPFVQEWVKRKLPLESPTKVPTTALGEAVSQSGGIKMVETLSDASANWNAPHQAFGWSKIDKAGLPMWEPVNHSGGSWDLENAPVWSWALRNATDALLSHMEKGGHIPSDLSNQAQLFEWFKSVNFTAKCFDKIVKNFSSAQQKELAVSLPSDAFARKVPKERWEWLKTQMPGEAFRSELKKFLKSHWVEDQEADTLRFCLREIRHEPTLTRREVARIGSASPSLLRLLEPHCQKPIDFEEIMRQIENNALGVGHDTKFNVTSWRTYGHQWANHYASMLKGAGMNGLSEKETQARLKHHSAESLLFFRTFFETLHAEGVLHPKGLWLALKKEEEKTATLGNLKLTTEALRSWAMAVERSMLLEKHGEVGGQPTPKAL